MPKSIANPIPKPVTLEEVSVHFEAHYTGDQEPWDYSQSGAELLRYQFVRGVGDRIMAKPDRLLEIGCSLGLFTRLLTGWAKNALITDIAPTATAKTEANMANVDPKGTQFTYETASGTAEFAPSNHFDIITLMDVMESVSDVPQIQYDMMHNMMRMVKPSGYILLTDYLHPKTFEKTKDKYRSWGLEIVECHYLNDRLFYNLRTNFKSISKSWPLRNLLASTQFAKVLRSLSSLMGKKGSKHLFLVMRKK